MKFVPDVWGGARALLLYVVDLSRADMPDLA